jgi:uncharacterized protein
VSTTLAFAPTGVPAAASATQAAVQALIGFGQVRHTRLRPARNAFAYPTYFLMLPLRTLAHTPCAALARNRAGALSFYDRDHGDGRTPEAGGALGWLDDMLHREGIDDARGEVWLHCYPRVLGHTFKPVSFWYCHSASGVLRAVVVEVNNTFGERHVYLLDRPLYGAEQTARKVFHVSPFCDVQGQYRFRFMTTPDQRRTVARIDYDDAMGALITTSVSGALEPCTLQAQRKALWRYGAMTLLIIARIHWQALRLWLLRVPFFKKPEHPSTLVTR